MKTYEVNLPYFKKGDDLSSCMQQTEDDAEALRLHAEMLEESRNIMRRLASLAKDGFIQIDTADTHIIVIRCAEEIGRVLVDEGAVIPFEWGDEEEETN